MCFLRKKKRIPKYTGFPQSWKDFLNKHLPFYRSLKPEEKIHFEERVIRFLNTTKITGIKTTVEDKDCVLIGASAIVPIFAFPNWEYHNLQEVLLYPKHFDENHTIGSKKKAILGMVGYGYMEGKMILSKYSLWHGFKNTTDKQNTAIHEFVHLLDKADGNIDGVLGTMHEQELALPWVELMEEKIKEIRENKSDIRAYGGTNHEEFLAVTSEYFFERPKLLEKKHPVLYEYMELMFGQELADKNMVKKASATQHWDPCPCESGKKFRNCCNRA
jgi:Mlc titration factor MtfA (ptsG expression regulator)